MSDTRLSEWMGMLRDEKDRKRMTEWWKVSEQWKKLSEDNTLGKKERQIAKKEHKVIWEQIKGLRAKYDETFRIQSYKIRDKEAKLVDLKFRPAQWKVWEAYRTQQNAGKPIRIIVLKSRRVGISTQVEAILYDRTSRTEEYEGLIVAHNDKTARYLLTIFKRYIRFGEASSDRNNDFFVRFKNTLSHVEVSTAYTLDTGHGLTLHFVHGSEVARWRNGYELMKGLGPTVGDNPETVIILESTADGLGGYFYDVWGDAKEGKNEYIAVFISWLEDPDCWLEFHSDDHKRRFMDTLNEEEKTLQEIHGAKPEQLNWRRMKIASPDFVGNIRKFHEQYPTTDIEAFLTSGGCAFDTDVLDSWKKEAPVPKYRGEVDLDNKKAVFTHVVSGNLKIYKHPVAGHKYAIGIDVAGDKPMDKDKADNFCIQVLDRNTLEYVAVWCGRAPTSEVAEKGVALGYYYNRAHIAPEQTGLGSALIGYLVDIHHYGSLYVREDREKIGDRHLAKWGWITSGKTKPVMIDNLATMIRLKQLRILDEATIDECLTYQELGHNKYAAAEGCLDDRVTSAAIALQQHLQLGEVHTPVRKVLTELEKRLRFLTKVRKAKVGAHFDGFTVVG